MKKIFLSIIMVLAVTTLFAQEWLNNGTNIYTNTGLFPSSNVGIKTTTPTQDLHIYESNGPANILLQSNYNEAGNKTLGSVNVTHTPTGDQFFFALRKWNGVNEMVQSCYIASTSTWAGFSSFNYSTRQFELKDGVADVLYSNTGNTYFNNNGGVGIGVTSLGTGVKFQVAGKIKVQEVEVALTPWPDYVFQPDYKLKPLEEVESFIFDNKHLPDVPSQEDVEANGLNLGQMNGILLQKIEELTLYMIELKKENDLLKERITKLEK